MRAEQNRGHTDSHLHVLYELNATARCEWLHQVSPPQCTLERAEISAAGGANPLGRVMHISTALRSSEQPVAVRCPSAHLWLAFAHVSGGRQAHCSTTSKGVFVCFRGRRLRLMHDSSPLATMSPPACANTKLRATHSHQ